MSDAEKPVEATTPPTEPATPPVVKNGPSVKTYQPTTMSLEAFRSLPLSQRKKLMRQELWDLHSAEHYEKKRQMRKESRKRRSQRLAQEAALQGTTAEGMKRRRLEQQEKSAVRLVLDMDFDERMDEKEIKSVASQVTRCYAVNRQAPKSVDLHVTRLHGKLAQRFADKVAHHKLWSPDHITMHGKEYLDLFEKHELVYLTADSPNVIETLDPAKAYVIGGIVDKNRYPGLTLRKAEEQGIAHGRLPIGEYVRMSTRKVMTVNQIFEMLVRYVDKGDWKTAFMDVIPQRKFKHDEAEAKDGDEASAEEEEEEEEGE
ncbi:tRNA methyltransferase 10 [Coemansia interrupta]|uniref:tRNA (guanine(9)-N1)-methyltransferase n=1 Tax=Coemansia interrupta TaxID=1126814 RepID=A0A9W8HKZ7_9FUNG|nr:tRNA methyltransferase 10 [Coemansia interrupta]